MNNTLVFIAIAAIVAALILATVVPVSVSAAGNGRGQQGIDKAREESGNTRSCHGLNEASRHNAGTLTPCLSLP